MPKGVSLSALGNKLPPESVSFVIDLNLIILNGMPFLPGRIWIKKTGRPNLKSTKPPMKIRTGDKSNKPNNETNISNILFKSSSFLLSHSDVFPTLVSILFLPEADRQVCTNHDFLLLGRDLLVLWLYPSQ